MSKQVLTQLERKKIRSEIYTESENQLIDYQDEKIKFFIRFTRNRSVLDLGSVDHFEGNWRSKYWLFKALLENSSELTGLDYYEDGVVALQKQGFNIIHGDAQGFDLGKKFDVITAGDLIEHLPNLDGFINSIKSSLKDDGMLVLSTPNPWCWKYMGYHILRKRLDRVNKEHVSWFCIQTLANLFERYGFSLVNYEYCSRRLYERSIPLPAHIKHTTLNAVFQKKPL